MVSIGHTKIIIHNLRINTNDRICFFVLESNCCFQTQRRGTLRPTQSEMDEAVSQALLPVLLWPGVFDTQSRLPVGSGREFSGYKVEPTDCAENTGGAAGVGDF